ncbi:MAG: hypothetical protein V1672_05340 [Candidatus Diapherotrites archaeon]
MKYRPKPTGYIQRKLRSQADEIPRHMREKFGLFLKYATPEIKEKIRLYDGNIRHPEHLNYSIKLAEKLDNEYVESAKKLNELLEKHTHTVEYSDVRKANVGELLEAYDSHIKIVIDSELAMAEYFRREVNYPWKSPGQIGSLSELLNWNRDTLIWNIANKLLLDKIKESVFKDHEGLDAGSQMFQTIISVNLELDKFHELITKPKAGLTRNNMQFLIAFIPNLTKLLKADLQVLRAHNWPIDILQEIHGEIETYENDLTELNKAYRLKKTKKSQKRI